MESFFSAEEAEALISDNTISYKLHFAYYRTTGDIIGLRMKEKKKKKKNTANKFAVLDREICLSKPRKPTNSKRILDFWL